MYLNNYFEYDKLSYTDNNSFQKIDYKAKVLFKILCDDKEFGEKLEQLFNGGNKNRKALVNTLRDALNNEAKTELADIYLGIKDLVREGKSDKVMSIQQLHDIQTSSEKIIKLVNDDLTDEEIIRVYKQSKFLLWFYKGLTRKN